MRKMIFFVLVLSLSLLFTSIYIFTAVNEVKGNVASFDIPTHFLSLDSSNNSQSESSANQNTGLIAAFAAAVGVIIGAILGPWMGFLTDLLKQGTSKKTESYRQQLTVYRILYENLIIMPNQDPVNNFSNWTKEDFHNWLRRATEILLQHLHLLPDSVIDKLQRYRKSISIINDDCENDVRWLHSHIIHKFKSLRKRLAVRD